MKVLIAIPAFNEEASIGAVLLELEKFHPREHILVVDDGSADATARIAREAGVRVISLAINLGVGGAMGTAYKYAALHDYDQMIQVDADGQHRPEHLTEMFDQLSDADIVVGSRFAGSGKFKSTVTRRLVQRIIAGVVSLYTRTKLTDVTSGFRATGRRAIELFAIHYPVEWLGDTVESLVLASREGLIISEKPVQMNERMAGVPSQSIYRATLYTLRIFFILLLAIVRSAPPGVTKRRKK